MAKFVILFQLLTLVFFMTFLLIFYFLSKNKPLFNPIHEKHYHYEVKDDDSHFNTLPMTTNIKVIPMPQFIHFEASSLSLLLLSPNDFHIASIQQPTEDLQSAILRYSKYISSLTGISVNIDQTSSPSSQALIIDYPASDSTKTKYPQVGEDESYTLNITQKGAYLHALSLTGVIRGLATFVQLIERDVSTEKSYVPLVNIIDRPRFVWRGLMVDVSRHWMPVQMIERTLNAMELSKLNVLHLHLSDDQGFRVESVQYPLLHDRKEYFTHKDIHHLLEYARQRRIRIVPEFDIPGHTTSWFVGYPELASAPGPYEVGTRWGVMKATMDPTRESTYTFLDGFLKEMSELFPDPYFHIGGDEVEGSQWTHSPSIQKFIQEHQLRNKNGLQAYFNRRIQTILKKYGKIMIGWEEILEEISENLAIDKDAVIHSWMGRKSLANAVKKGYRGLLSNGYYLDHLKPAIDHYTVDPILDEDLHSLSEKQRSHILGGEACMWAEYVTESTVDSRIWPRMIAIAERFWSPSSVTNQSSLYERMFRMNYLLDKMQTGLTHLSSYKRKLQNLIAHSNQKQNLLHPFFMLADVCEPSGLHERTQTGRYTSTVPLTTFADALQSESEFIWKLETFSVHDRRFRDIFQTWSVHYVRLQRLFDEVGRSKGKAAWGQDLEQLSKNLARVGQIGLRILDYKKNGVLHHEKNNTMNSWTISHWISHHNTVLNQLEIGVTEVRLAAVRPVRRLLKSIQPNQ